MKKFTVFFEIYGKKMKTPIYALNEDRAKQIVKDAVIFWKIVEEKNKEDKLEDLKNDLKNSPLGDVFKDIFKF